MTLQEMMESGQVFGGLLVSQPATPITLAAVNTVGLTNVGGATVAFESSNLIPACIRYGVRFDVNITADLLAAWPWGYALLFQSPAAALLAVQPLPAIPGQVVRVGDVWTIRSALTLEDLIY